jgi:methylamine dehydrogenase heavy chain
VFRASLQTICQVMNRVTRGLARVPGARLVATCAAVLLVAAAAGAELRPEEIGKVLRLPDRAGPHWFWISDILLHRTALFDGDDGRLLGAISSGTAGTGFVIYPLFSPDRREIYMAETYWSRGVRGERTDVVTVYDAKTLGPLAEIPIPAKRGEYFPGNASNALSDDGRFMAVLNITPASSVTVVDVVARKFTAEIETPGCSLVFAAGNRRFFMLCGDGQALVITLDERGNEAGLERSERFFEVHEDPLTEKAVRRGHEWIFVSYEGLVYTVDVSGPKLAFGQTWSLLDESDRRDSWRIGGLQHLAVHSTSGRLYALMHQGPPDTHKAPGTEVWVYDLGRRERVQRIRVMNPLVSFVAEQAKIGRETTTARMVRRVLTSILPNPGVERILVTQDDDPVLVVSAGFPPTITVHDAASGEVVTEIKEPGIGFSLMFAP